MTDTRLHLELYEYLTRHNVLTLAYQDSEGPQACAVWYAAGEDLTLYFLSAQSTRHGAALADGGKIAFAIQRDDQEWRSIQGVQGRGLCRPVTPEQRANAWQAYSRRFPFVIKPVQAIAAALAAMTLFSISPTWLRLIDNTKGFGHKEELFLDTQMR
jgi:uncharacterized protein YhbP (UPF0306 family)